MNETSLSLLDRIREAPDAESWDRLVSLYAPLLRRWVRRYEIQASDVDDIVQEVLSAVLNDLPKFQHSRRTGAFRNWLRTILVNRVRLYWRSRKYQPLATGSSSIAEMLDQLQDDSSQISEIWNREHNEVVLKRLMKAIRPQFEDQTWLAFQRQVVDRKRADAVAQELEMSLSSVYKAKSRVLAALRREAQGLVDEI
jgi:RNA polymerase sigma-70 factor (ECF subfamily)